MPYGTETYGWYVYGLEEFVLTGQGISTGEFEEDYGEKYGIGTGRFDSDYSFLSIGEGISSGLLNADYSYLLVGEGASSGVVDGVLLEALVDYACYLLNTDTKRTYQFGTYEFRGIGRFNKKLIGIRNNKIYDLETVATHDDGVDISSYFEIETDFGMPNKKGFRSIFTQDNRVRVTITDRNSNAVVADVTQDEFRALPRDLIDKAFTIKVENIDGEQITIRRLQGTLNILDIKGG